MSSRTIRSQVSIVVAALTVVASAVLAVGTASASPSPGLVTVVNGLNHPYEVTYDATGNMFIAGGDQQTIDEVTAAQLAGPTPHSAAVVATLPLGVSRVVAVAFDAAGNLWALSQRPANLYEVPATAAESGSFSLGTPVATIPRYEGCDMKIDAAGDIFVSACGDIYEITAAQIRSGATPYSATALTSGAHFYGIGFDALGNLYGADCGSDTIQRFSAAALASGTFPRPSTTVVNSSSGLSCPWGVTVDGAGNLFISDYNNSQVSELSAAQLAGSLPATPTVLASGVPLQVPLSLTVNAQGDLLIADYWVGLIVALVGVATPVGAVAPPTGLGVVASGSTLTASWTTGPAGVTYRCTLLFGFNQPSSFTVATTTPTCSFSNLSPASAYGVSVVAVSAAGATSAAVQAFSYNATTTTTSPTTTTTTPSRTRSIICEKGTTARFKTVRGTHPTCPRGWHRV